MQIGFLTAFLGGALALLSPCSALLLPAFFASTVGARIQLLTHGAVFYLGLVLVLVPFGLGLGAAGSFLMTQRGLIILVTAIVLVGFGVLQILGRGFGLARLLPGAARLQGTGTGYLRTLLLGAVGGVSGFCAGPILGAILTLALAQGSIVLSGALLAVYGAGIVVPLVAIAALWSRLGARGRRLLRGRTFTVAGRELHTVSAVTGVLMIVTGVLFWLTNGFVGMPALVPTDVQMWMQERGRVLANPLLDALAVALAAGLALWGWVAVRRRARRTTS